MGDAATRIKQILMLDLPIVTKGEVQQRQTRSVDVVFFKELTEGWYSITNEKSGAGFGMAWDPQLFKYLWMWQVYGGHHDYPWYGRTYNCALEPFTSYPPAGVPNAIHNGSAYLMKPAEVIETDLVAVAYQDGKANRVCLDGTAEREPIQA